MVSDNVEPRVRSILAELFALDEHDISAETSTETVADWNSLQHLNLILSLEEEFGFEIGDEEAVAIDSYPRIVSMVRSRLGATIT